MTEHLGWSSSCSRTDPCLCEGSAAAPVLPCILGASTTCAARPVFVYQVLLPTVLLKLYAIVFSHSVQQILF